MTNLEKTDVILLLLYAKGQNGLHNESIVGITRLIKLIFLLEKQTSIKKIFEFEPYKMGPYSSDIYNAVDFLENFPTPEKPFITVSKTDSEEMLVNPEQLKYIEDSADKDEPPPEINKKYQLSDLGQKIAEQLWTDLDDDLKKKIESIKKNFGSLTLRQLLRFVYSKYPEMTINSEIKDQL